MYVKKREFVHEHVGIVVYVAVEMSIFYQISQQINLNYHWNGRNEHVSLSQTNSCNVQTGAAVLWTIK